MAAPTRSTILSLYKQMLKEGQKITDYNFRRYALRRTMDAFKENKTVTDVDKCQALFKKAQENLDMLKRQSIIGQLFGSDKLVIESQTSTKK